MSLQNLELFIYNEKKYHYLKGKGINAIQAFSLDETRALKIFDDYELNQEEKNMLAVIALNADSYGLFKAAVQNGAQFINYPDGPRIPEIAPELQQYKLIVFSNTARFHAYLEAGGPYFDRIPGTQESTGTGSENDLRYCAQLPYKVFESVIRRECLPVDSEQKKERLSKILRLRGPLVFRNCSPEFSKEIMQAYSLPPGTLEVLCESGSTSLENDPLRSFQDMVSGYESFKEKTKQCLINEADEELMIRKESLAFIGFPKTQYSSDEHIVLSEKEIAEKREKECALSRCLFLEEELPDGWQLKSKKEHYSLDKTTAYDRFVNNSLPSIYFWIGMLEKNVKQVHQMSPEEKLGVNPEHPLFQHTRDLMVQIAGHGKDFGPLILSHYGILKDWADSPLFHIETIAPLIQWAINFENPDIFNYKWHGCQPVFRELIATMGEGLKQKPIFELEQLLSEHPEELHASKAILSPVLKCVLSSKIKNPKPIQISTPTTQPRF